MKKNHLSLFLMLASIVCFNAFPICAKEGQPFTPSEFVVRAGQYRYFTVEVSEGELLRIAGKFRASGGSGNDIQVLAMDEENFENWKNGHRAKCYFDSDKATVGTINLTLGVNKYYLVFSNTYSLISPKEIASNIMIY